MVKHQKARLRFRWLLFLPKQNKGEDDSWVSEAFKTKKEALDAGMRHRSQGYFPMTLVKKKIPVGAHFASAEWGEIIQYEEISVGLYWDHL